MEVIFSSLRNAANVIVDNLTLKYDDVIGAVGFLDFFALHTCMPW